MVVVMVISHVIFPSTACGISSRQVFRDICMTAGVRHMPRVHYVTKAPGALTVCRV